MKLKQILELGPRAAAETYIMIGRLRVVNGLVATTHFVCPHILNSIAQDQDTGQYYEICVYCGYEEKPKETESIS